MVGTRKFTAKVRETADSIQEAVKNTTGLVTAALAIGAAALLLAAATLIMTLRLRKVAFNAG